MFPFIQCQPYLVNIKSSRTDGLLGPLINNGVVLTSCDSDGLIALTLDDITRILKNACYELFTDGLLINLVLTFHESS